MHKLFGSLAAAALVAAGGTAVHAATVTLRFDGTQGVTTSVRFSDHLNGEGENGWDNFNSNTGSLQGLIVVSLPEEDWYYPVTLFRADVSAIPAGSTITGVSLSIGNEWWNPVTFENVELYGIQVPGSETWQPGNGDYLARNSKTENDRGAGQWFANMLDNDNGIAWDGSTQSKFDVRGYGDPASYYDRTPAAAFTALLGSGTLVGDANWNTLEGNDAFVQLVQSWVDGGENEGFALSTLNASRTGDSESNLFSLLRDGAGLVVEYTPVPEPGALSLLAVGGLALLRRRRA